MIDVKEAIPHRPPFLFVDEIVSMTEDSIEGKRRMREDEEFFRGHYPGRPLMPGVLLCEAVIQTGAILLSRRIGPGSGKVPVLTRITNAKFKSMVRPGDLIELEARVQETMGDVFFMRGSAAVGGKKVMTVEFACTMAEG